MIIDPQIVAQAKAFVNALKLKQSARVPALKFSQWQQFMSTVHAEMSA
ncbi:succinate dehydrogenase flavoprotein subunit [Enterobacteriaceae bacterium H11S18]|nr:MULTISPECIES: succinate dehydrogenase flavoprotein subunit [Enterobacteriaceae]MCT4707700.1 succinate dehydrogenase flavoprotein subunit [Dryocola clanedunensis]MCT4709206.1 succinate dehydrogenase flavoprotein subunit [Dryocola clanedunensis]